MPKPSSLRRLGGWFRFEPPLALRVDPSGFPRAVADELAACFEGGPGGGIFRGGDRSRMGVHLVRDPRLGREEYILVVRPEGATLRASASAGLFYGLQSLVQLLPPPGSAEEPPYGRILEMPCVEIRDRPRFSWRGIMLDSGRQALPVETIKRYLDLMALHKMNVFHWHLTDDQGWRVEIRKFPRLTGHGSRVDCFGAGEGFGGHYSQEEIREIVAYAMSRQVMVVPEIDVPGHSTAALSSYPELSCRGEEIPLTSKLGIHPNVFCAGNPRVYEFLKDVLAEVLELFPSPYVHIGGDEVPKGAWEACARCRDFMRREGLMGAVELQSRFLKEIAAFLQERGRKVIGWDKILEGGAFEGAIVQHWRHGWRELGGNGGVDAARMGHEVIWSPDAFYYLHKNHATIPLRRVYEHDPMPEELDPEEGRRILGGEACFWHGFRPVERLDARAFPRMVALAEVLWTPSDGRTWEDFLARLAVHSGRLDALGVAYYDYYLRLHRAGISTDALAGGETIGTWTPEDLSADASANILWDVSAFLKNPGPYVVEFEYTRGAHGIHVDWVALSADGKEIARDGHEGWSGFRKGDPYYLIEVPPIPAPVNWRLEVRVRCGGTDSYGRVLLHAM